MEALMIIKPALYLIVTTAVMGAVAGYKKSITEKVIRGALIPMALFGVAYYISIFILRNKSLDLIAGIYYGIFALTLAGFIVYDIKVKKKEEPKKTEDGEPLQKGLIAIMIAIIAYQTLRVGIMEPFAISDGFAYNSYVNDAAVSGIVYNNDYLGGTEENGTVYAMPRNMFTVSWYMYEAHMARVTGTPALVVIGTVLPVYIMLVSYVVLWILGMTLLKKERNKTALFMIICAAIMEVQLIVNDQSAFFLVWPTWGKNITSALICPILAAMFIEMVRGENEEKKAVALMTLYSFVAVNSTSAAMIAIPMEMGALSIVYAIREKRISYIVSGIVICLPEVLQFFLYKFALLG